MAPIATSAGKYHFKVLNIAFGKHITFGYKAVALVKVYSRQLCIQVNLPASLLCFHVFQYSLQHLGTYLFISIVSQYRKTLQLYTIVGSAPAGCATGHTIYSCQVMVSYRFKNRMLKTDKEIKGEKEAFFKRIFFFEKLLRSTPTLIRQ